MMANQEQLNLLRQGVGAWNEWRVQHPRVEVDLIGADLSDADLFSGNLSRADLSRADLSRASLGGANLFRTDLSDADLSVANLGGASLIRANLSHTDLSRANLGGANLFRADLSVAHLFRANLGGANLSRANLSHTSLSRANLSDADLSNAITSWTIFSNLDLRGVKGLETISHEGPSTIGTDTLERSQGDIPEAFLRGAGLSDTFITYARALTSRPIEYYTCFISYCSKDQEFAQRLYADLQSKGVRCWFAPEDMKTGDKLRPRIDESIRLYDKLLLVLSEHAVASAWVEHEVETALDKEQEGHATVLFPLRLDQAVMDRKTGWASHIRLTRHITDFSQWKQHDDYQKSLDRLLRDLKAGGRANHA